MRGGRQEALKLHTISILVKDIIIMHVSHIASNEGEAETSRVSPCGDTLIFWLWARKVASV